jgi:hypothetical protein
MKTKKFIRSGPHLPVNNLSATLKYYRDVLGFYEEWTEGDKDEGIRRMSYDFFLRRTRILLRI